ncbi:NUDIX hydrolase [Bifidobacterium samirii]|uniref:Phosphohydrolase n=1 Tax=Bifidobacterium samirii TaxID=2306974 RepID=A0A430FUD8_9BIFI|nr:NUDIX domain-containing protein [Bifidobacterium samirii]RSX56692.1 phosphohydrolase [Bifidobacterium samirii]
MGYGNVSERRSQPPQVGVSVVILALREPTDGGHGDHDGPSLWMPLVRRVRQPHLGDWALPGGGLRADRSLRRSAYEALASTTGLPVRCLEQAHAFGDLARSRGGLPMVSIVYWAFVDAGGTHDFAERDNVAWFPVDRLPDLAFDHRGIVDYVLAQVRGRIVHPEMVTRLVGPEFTLRQLHAVAQAVAGRDVDLANFRRRMLASGMLEETGEKVREGRQRPAAVYRYVPCADGDVGDASGAAGDVPRGLGAAADAAGAVDSGVWADGAPGRRVRTGSALSALTTAE